MKPYFPNNHAKHYFNIILNEKYGSLLKNRQIADDLNSYFDSVKDLLDFISWSIQSHDKNIETPKY